MLELLRVNQRVVKVQAIPIPIGLRVRFLG